MTGFESIPQFTVFETEFHSTQTYHNPFWDVSLQVRLIAPSGREQTVDAFWDGGCVWRLRFSPDGVGRWRWQTICSNTADKGLHGQEGTVRCVPYEGDNPLYRRGPVQVAENGRYLSHADGTPFFWLADTAWNGGLRASSTDWTQYLRGRRQQGFSAIQWVTTQWRGASADARGEVAFEGTEQITLNPAFFQRLDRKLAAINKHHLLAVPVMLWTLTESDPGQILAEADAIRLVRYQAARWGAFQVVWFLGGDGRYKGQAERWQRIGRAVFGDRRNRLVTMHPSGQSWVGDEFRHEPWFDFIGYQSGHGDSAAHLAWLVDGPPANRWDETPPMPVINLEPNYELHPAYHSRQQFSAFEVRRAAYWSLLVSPTAGVSFGHNAIWVWPEAEEVPEGHEAIGPVPPWFVGYYTPGVQSMAVLAAFFREIGWWKLRPAPELLSEQPGQAEPDRFVAAAKAEDNSFALLYLPVGGSIDLNTGRLPATARWVNPRSGDVTPAGPLAKPSQTLTAPNSRDWLLWISR